MEVEQKIDDDEHEAMAIEVEQQNYERMNESIFYSYCY